MPNVQWKTPDDGQRNCPKHAEFLDKNKFGKLVGLLVLLQIKISGTVSATITKFPDSGGRLIPKFLFIDRNSSS